MRRAMLSGMDQPEAAAPDRREFLKLALAAAAAAGLPAASAIRFVEAAAAGAKPSVIWLHFMECTGCTESLLRTGTPGFADLILDVVSLDYHETVMAAAGHQAEQALHAAMERHRGKYVLVVEGAVPTRDDGVYCKIGGRTALENLRTVAADAAAVIAIGSCASFGGVAAAEPNPTAARGVPQILEGQPVVTLPGCPANPYNFLGTVMHLLEKGALPELDALGRPLFAYGMKVHDDCPRRPHYDAGRFAGQFGDAGHRAGWCLAKLGCKGPETHGNCSVLTFGDVAGANPVGVGHPCFGCTEQVHAFRAPVYQALPAVESPLPLGTIGAAAAAGAVGAGALVAGLRATRDRSEAKDQNPEA